MNETYLKWNHTFNLTLLRLISFSLDKFWAEKGYYALDKEITDEKIIPYKTRVITHHDRSKYTYLYFLAYISYSPTLVAGPIISFNAWASQVHIPQNTHSNKETLKYVLRTIMNFIAFEIFLHCYFCHSLAKRPENFEILKNYPFHILALTNLFELAFIWFKFLCIWRYLRVWALLDGIEVPENMNRCVFNNYNFEGFWRSWHRSFNQWLIRYLFIPLGGTKYKMYNIWVIFTFVLLWHDMNLNLVFWAWGICLALMPEMIIKSIYNFLWKTYWFKHVAAFGCSFYIILLILANLAGYGGGVKALEYFINDIGYFEFLKGLIFAIVFMHPGVILMFLKREYEPDDIKY